MFQWDPLKAAANLSKHGVSFGEAASVFADPDGLEGPDLGHSSRESRFLRIGKSERWQDFDRRVYHKGEGRCRNDPSYQRETDEPERKDGLPAGGG